MSTRYRSAEQEKYFQPWRLKVLTYHKDGSVWANGYTVYLTVLLNTVTREALLVKPGKADSPVKRNSHGYAEHSSSYSMLKSSAIEAAKDLAVERNLPFDLQEDVAIWEDVLDGPVMHCLICGATLMDTYEGRERRGFQPDVCPECRAIVDRTSAGQDDTQDVLIGCHTFRMREVHFYDREGMGEGDLSKQLALAMLEIAEPEHLIDYKRRGDSDTVDAGMETDWVYATKTQGWRIPAMRKIAKIVQAAVELAYESGLHNGSSLLNKLVSGEMHPQDFEDARSRK